MLENSTLPGTVRHYSPRHLHRTAYVAVQVSRASGRASVRRTPHRPDVLSGVQVSSLLMTGRLLRPDKSVRDGIGKNKCPSRNDTLRVRIVKSL
jgi:hypothetical protein